MKKLVLLFVLSVGFHLQKSEAQSIPLYNSSFEIWDNLQGLIDVPDSWPSSDLLWFSEGYTTHNVYRDANSHWGKYAARIGPDTAGKKIWPGFIAAKFPINKIPKYFGFYYIDSINKAESGVIKVKLLRWNKISQTEDSVGGGEWDFPDSLIKKYIFGEFPILYKPVDTSTAPDSVSIIMEVVSAATSLPSGHIVVDDVYLLLQQAGVPVYQVSEGFQVFPNPSTGLLNVLMQGNEDSYYKLDIIDLNGTVLFSKELVGIPRVQLDVSNYPPGMYLARISSENGILVRKVFITQ